MGSRARIRYAEYLLCARVHLAQLPLGERDMTMIAFISVLPRLSMLALSLFYLALLAGGQEDAQRVYIGTGVNGVDSAAAAASDNDVIVLGGLFSIFGRSGVNPRSVQRIEAVTLAVQKINDDPTILPGVKLAYEIRGTRGDVNTALEESLKFVSSRTLRIGNSSAAALGISGVLGAGFSSVSTEVARLLRLFQIPQISYASTADVLSDKDTFEYFLRTVPPDSFQARALADIIVHYDWTYVVAMHTGDVYGRGGIAAFLDELKKRNDSQRCITTVASIELPSNEDLAEDFDQAVETLNREWVSNATVVVLFATRNTGIGFFTAVKKRVESDPEFASRNFTWVGSDGWGNNVPAEFYDVVRGSLSVAPQTFSNSEFEEYFLSLNPLTHTANPWFFDFWELVFNCSIQVRSGYELCNLNSQSLSRDIFSLQSTAVTPAMDAVYAFAHAIHRLQRDYCGASQGLCPEILDDRSGGIALRGELLLSYLHNVSFSPGFSTKNVSFNENGDPQGTNYSVSNLQQNSSGSFSFRVVGNWDAVADTPLKIHEAVQWSHDQGDSVPVSVCSHPCGDGEFPLHVPGQSECCWVCTECPGRLEVSTGLTCEMCGQGFKPNERKTECVMIPISFLSWSHGWSIVTLIMMCAGIVATAAVVIIFVFYQNHPIVKASSRELSAVLLCGIMLCYLLPFFFIAKPAPWICGIRRFSVGFCFSLCYSALLVKTNRIHRIFNRKITSLEAPPLIGPISQLSITAILVSIQVAIATVWLIVRKPNIEFTYQDFSTELNCDESAHVGLFISLGYNFVLLLITTYFAFRTRNVPENFNEAKYISFTMYTLCVLWLAFIPTYIAATATLGVIYQTGSLVLAIIFNATITLSCLFAPKIYFLFRAVHKTYKQNNSSQSETASKTSNINLTTTYTGALSGISLPPLHNPVVDNGVGKVDVSTQTDVEND